MRNCDNPCHLGWDHVRCAPRSSRISKTFFAAAPWDAPVYLIACACLPAANGTLRSSRPRLDFINRPGKAPVPTITGEGHGPTHPQPKQATANPPPPHAPWCVCAQLHSLVRLVTLLAEVGRHVDAQCYHLLRQLGRERGARDQLVSRAVRACCKEQPAHLSRRIIRTRTKARYPCATGGRATASWSGRGVTASLCWWIASSRAGRKFRWTTPSLATSSGPTATAYAVPESGWMLIHGEHAGVPELGGELLHEIVVDGAGVDIDDDGWMPDVY
eukprot:4175264-Prymnesium_polylepis.1